MNINGTTNNSSVNIIENKKSCKDFVDSIKTSFEVGKFKAHCQTNIRDNLLHTPIVHCSGWYEWLVMCSICVPEHSDS